MRLFCTYFPVAILMVVEWIWATYDLQIKFLMPWAVMSRGFTSAERGWLLDYIGANYFEAIFTAVRYRHFVVLLATAGLWATAVASVVTTSLFQVQGVSRTFPRRLARVTAINTSAVDPAALADAGYTTSYLGRQVLSL